MWVIEGTRDLNNFIAKSYWCGPENKFGCIAFARIYNTQELAEKDIKTISKYFTYREWFICQYNKKVVPFEDELHKTQTLVKD